MISGWYSAEDPNGGKTTSYISYLSAIDLLKYAGTDYSSEHFIYTLYKL